MNKAKVLLSSWVIILLSTACGDLSNECRDPSDIVTVENKNLPECQCRDNSIQKKFCDKEEGSFVQRTCVNGAWSDWSNEKDNSTRLGECWRCKLGEITKQKGTVDTCYNDQDLFICKKDEKGYLTRELVSCFGIDSSVNIDLFIDHGIDIYGRENEEPVFSYQIGDSNPKKENSDFSLNQFDYDNHSYSPKYKYIKVWTIYKDLYILTSCYGYINKDSDGHVEFMCLKDFNIQKEDGNIVTCHDGPVSYSADNARQCSCDGKNYERRSCGVVTGASELRICNKNSDKWKEWNDCWACTIGGRYKENVREDICESGQRWTVCEVGEDGFLTLKVLNPLECVVKNNE